MQIATHTPLSDHNADPARLKIVERLAMESGEEAPCTAAELRASVCKFASWLMDSGYESYDPYDVWGTGYGRVARRLYYRKNPLGLAMTAPLILMEVFCPALRGLLIKKDRYPTADAQLLLAFLNMYVASQNGLLTTSDPASRTNSERAGESLLARARGLADDLLMQSVPGYSGACWGYPFDWQNVNGLMPKNTPHIIATPDCYEAFTGLFEITGESRYLEVARSIAEFAFRDLNDTPTGADAAASSYTPYDSGKVVNASAYRALLLFDAARRFQCEAFREKASKNLQFILQSQQTDGSWLYAIDNPAEAFIDNFHTCFVLKNLHKINIHLQCANVREAIRRGYEWYRKSLFDDQDNPKSFAIAPRVQIVRLEMYNIAEAITLGVLLREEIRGAFTLAETLAARLIRQHQLPEGHWVTRIYLGGIRHTVPFLRWPQSQLFLAITYLLAAFQPGESRPSRKLAK